MYNYTEETDETVDLIDFQWDFLFLGWLVVFLVVRLVDKEEHDGMHRQDGTDGRNDRGGLLLFNDCE